MRTIEQVQRGLQILSSYPDVDVEAGHDEIYVGIFEGEEDKTTAEHRAQLKELGWSYSDDHEGWLHYV